ncbi:MAG: hypothetical protein KME46_33320 [Brasilonema angustatum HA4187-MV1]|jgi:hypothetical protein|nr:hypothetical protein [Brasilonema angustatum HA4187-MV1]
MKEQDSTSTARIKPPREVSQPVYIDFRDLEAFREIDQAKRRERVQEYTHTDGEK